MRTPDYFEKYYTILQRRPGKRWCLHSNNIYTNLDRAIVVKDALVISFRDKEFKIFNLNFSEEFETSETITKSEQRIITV